MMVKLKRRRERVTSICFTWFPFSELGEHNIYHDSGVFYKNVGFYFEGDCEELVGGNHRK